jgi:hypothetical protein
MHLPLDASVLPDVAIAYRRYLEDERLEQPPCEHSAGRWMQSFRINVFARI